LPKNIEEHLNYEHDPFIHTTFNGI